VALAGTPASLESVEMTDLIKGQLQPGAPDSTVTVLKNYKKSPRGIVMREQNPADKSLVEPHRQAEDLLKQVEQESIVDSEKVKRIKAAIANGTYRVDPNTVADKLLEMETELTRDAEGDTTTD
jgi:flagellar biosynthesis anti-sigma factor FlgM